MQPLRLMALTCLAAIAFPGCATLSQPSTGSATLVGAGDIAWCGDQPAAASVAEKTAALIEQIPGTVFAAGDLAYPNGSESEFRDCYGPTWGRFRDRTLPAPGNHEYNSPDASPYYAYWGRRAGDPDMGYYAVQLGDWRIIALNSNIDAQAGSPQETWLRTELKEHRARCTLAFWHHPVFSSARSGVDPRMQDIWQTLYDGGADVVVNGHWHHYERFLPQNPKGEADGTHGIREFVVGTGGARLARFRVMQPNSEVRDSDTHGVLKLTLASGSYRWEFVPATGGTFRDAGEAACHD